MENKSIGQRLREVRKFHRYTQKVVSEFSGIAEPTIRKYESGKLNPKHETLVKLAEALITTVEYLRDGIGPMSTKPELISRPVYPIEYYALYSFVDGSIRFHYWFNVRDEHGVYIKYDADKEIEQANSFKAIILDTDIPNEEKDELMTKLCDALFRGMSTRAIAEHIYERDEKNPAKNKYDEFRRDEARKFDREEAEEKERQANAAQNEHDNQ